MSHIPLIGNQISSEMTNMLSETVSDWAGRIVRQIPQFMQNHGVVFCVIGTVNALFFSTIHLLVDHVDQNLEKANKFTANGKLLKNFVLDVILMGSFALVFNLALSKLTRYSLSKTMLAIIASTYVALRIILKKSDAEVDVISKEGDKKSKLENKEEEKVLVKVTEEEKKKYPAIPAKQFLEEN